MEEPEVAAGLQGQSRHLCFPPLNRSSDIRRRKIHFPTVYNNTDFTVGQRRLKADLNALYIIYDSASYTQCIDTVTNDFVQLQCDTETEQFLSN